VATVVIDDHLLRDVLSGDRSQDLGGLATAVATTGLWLFRLTSALADPDVMGKLVAPVAALSTEQQDRFRTRLVALPDAIEILHLRQLSWPMAQLQSRHRAQGRRLSAAMTEALAAAHALEADIAVSHLDVGPDLKAAAEHDGISFHVL
jgi:predicted nucleic acid-binding protein